MGSGTMHRMQDNFLNDNGIKYSVCLQLFYRITVFFLEARFKILFRFYFSVIANISKLSGFNLSSREKAPGFALKISIFEKPSVLSNQVFSEGTQCLSFHLSSYSTPLSSTTLVMF